MCVANSDVRLFFPKGQLRLVLGWDLFFVCFALFDDGVDGDDGGGDDVGEIIRCPRGVANSNVNVVIVQGKLWPVALGADFVVL